VKRTISYLPIFLPTFVMPSSTPILSAADGSSSVHHTIIAASGAAAPSSGNYTAFSFQNADECTARGSIRRRRQRTASHDRRVRESTRDGFNDCAWAQSGSGCPELRRGIQSIHHAQRRSGVPGRQQHLQEQRGNDRSASTGRWSGAWRGNANVAGGGARLRGSSAPTGPSPPLSLAMPLLRPPVAGLPAF